MIDDTELDQRLARSDWFAGAEPATLAQLMHDSRSEARSGLTRRVIAAVAGSLLVLGAGIVAAPAAADAVRDFLAQAQWFPAAGGEILPDSEWVDLGASDLHDYIEHVFPEDLPLPPTQTREYLVDRTYEMSSASGALGQEVGLRRMIENLAFCGWSIEYITAIRDGDDARASSAADVLVAAADWPALVATDGGGITDRMREAALTAQTGERGAVYDLFTAGDCTVLGFDPNGGGE